ncbi:MAG: nonstructural protein [Microvirus sp.]|nr:MAG: nonstructural protein [Microvirus sp.]
MEVILCAVLDDKVGAFAQVMQFPTRGVALRSFMDEVSRPDSEIAKYSSDFSFYYLGTLDQVSGFISQPAMPERLASASDFVVNV